MKPIIQEGVVINRKSVFVGMGAFIRGPHTYIGDNCSIGAYAEISHHVNISDGVRIHSKCFIAEYTQIKKGAWIGPCACITNARYPGFEGAKKLIKGVIIEEGVIIGANSTILSGIKIGKDSFIGAGAVVTKDVPENEVWVGNPAKKLKLKSEYSVYV